ncbi:MAG: alpha/beta hydrolase [Candidatus Nanopelagicales bacterium]
MDLPHRLMLGASLVTTRTSRLDRGATRRVLQGSAALVGAALLAACTTAPDQGTTVTPTSTPSGSASASESPTGGGLARFYDQTLQWKKCGGSFLCTDLTVPLDYSAPDGDTLKISVLKLPASDQGKRIGSLVLNPGGPGGSGVDYARAARAVVDEKVRAVYDVVGFDPRGVGRSEAVQCLTDAQTDVFMSSDPTPDDPAEVAELEKLSKQFADSCEKNSGALLPHIGTEDAARDIDVLRAALGDDKLTWLGASYGTLLGATYAGLFPDKTGRMVLDGALDPTLTNNELAHGQAKGFELALQHFVEWCAKQAECPLPRDTQGGVDRVKQFLDDLDANPIPTGDPKRPLTQGLAANAILSYMYVPPFDWEQLQFGLQLAFDGDGSMLLSMLDARMQRSENGKYVYNPYSSFLSISAVDRPDRPDAAESADMAQMWAKESPVFGPYLGWGNLVFGYWPIPAVGEPKAITAPGTGPILVVGTTYDPATPYPWAQALAKQLENGVLLTRVGDGHTAYGMGSQCIDDAIDTYLVDGTPPVDGTVCKTDR